MNEELVKIFYEIANYLQLEDVAFRPFAYQRAAMALESLELNIKDIYQEKGLTGLMEVPGVGQNIAERVEEYIKTGRILYLEELKKKTPIKLEELMSVEGLGPKKIKVLYKELGVKDLKTLEKAAKDNKIAQLARFGEKSQNNILEGINFLKKSGGRFLLGEALPYAKNIINYLKELKDIEQISLAGSLRRMKETIGDIDILVTAKNSKAIMDRFVSFPGVTKIWMQGPTKSSIRTKEGFNVDIRVIKKKSYGSALQYFTGSKEHNIALRRIAMEKKLKLSEYGLFSGSKMIAGWDEKDIYKKLGLDFIEPELREDRGEIIAAKENRLPKLIELKDIKGDLHCHSTWSGGVNSIEDMVKAARELGYTYLGISDHTIFLKIENGLDERRLSLQGKEIDKINDKLKKDKINFKVLKGCEANILKDGSIDIKDSTLSKLDYVIAGVHSSLKMNKADMTERIIKAMKNPHVDIIAHLTGRILNRREEYQFDLDKILRAAQEYKVIFEVNASPYRLDLNDQNIKRVKDQNIKIVINSDAHEKSQLNVIEFGVAQARRGWATSEDVVNSWPVSKLLKCF